MLVFFSSKFVKQGHKLGLSNLCACWIMHIRGGSAIFFRSGSTTTSTPINYTVFLQNVQFQKIFIPPPRKGFFLTPPHPSGNYSKTSYISLYFLIYQNPPSPRKFQSLLWGEYGYFLELHNTSCIRKLPVISGAGGGCATPAPSS